MITLPIQQKVIYQILLIQLTITKLWNNEFAVQWNEAMKDELKSMAQNSVWELKPLPEGFKAVDCKQIFKTNHSSECKVKQFKARLVTKGFKQHLGIDYDETFSSVLKDSLRIILTLTAHFDLELHQMDMKTAFLDGDLKGKKLYAPA